MFQFINQHFAKIRLAVLVLAVLQVSGCGSPQDRAQKYYDNGMQLLAEHDHARARIQFRSALKNVKDLLPAWQALAQIEEADRNWDGLIPVLRTIVELAPTDVGAKVKLARLLLIGSPDEALNLVNAALEVDSRNADVLAVKALTLFRLKNTLAAVLEARAALEIDPGNTGAMIILAAEKLAGGDTASALRILDSDPVAREKDLGIQLFKLKIFEQTQDLPQAEAMLRRIVELHPEEPAFRRQLIKLYIYQGRPQDAEKEQRVVASANPTDAKAGLELIGLLYTIKGPAAAREELVSSIEAGGDVFPYQIALAELDFAQGTFTESDKLLRRLIETETSSEHIVAAQAKLAEMLLQRKETAAAEVLISEILQKDKRNNAALKLRASVRLSRGELEPAITDLRQALGDQPRSVDLMLLLAVAYERSGTIELAEKQFADAMQASNFEPRVGLIYVTFLQRRGSDARAEDVATELASRWPKNIDVLSTIGQLRLARQNWRGAQEIAESIRRIGNDRGIADQILSAALSGSNKYDESIGILENAYAAAPTAGQPMFALVQALIRAKKTDRAAAILQAVLKANPANAEAHVLLGSIHATNNAPDQAEKSFRTAIEKQPKNVVGYQALAVFHLKRNEGPEALKIVQAGLKQQPDSSSLRMVLGGMLEVNGDYAAAITEYESLLEKEPMSLVVVNNLASLLADHRTDKASLDRAYSLALSLRKSPVPQFKDTLGWVTYQHGDYKSAVPLLEEAAAALPNQVLVQYHLAMGYLALDEPAKATERLNAALKLAVDKELRGKIRDALKRAGT